MFMALAGAGLGSEPTLVLQREARRRPARLRVAGASALHRPIGIAGGLNPFRL